MVKASIPDVNAGTALSAAENDSVRKSFGQEAQKAYEKKLPPGTVVRVDVYVVDKDGSRVGETTKVVSTTTGRRLSHGGNHVIIEVYISLAPGLSVAEAAVAQAALTVSVAALPTNIGADPAFAGLLSVAGVTPAEVTAAPAVQEQYVVAASPPPPCFMQCTQLMNGLSKKSPDMCLQMGADGSASCYPYGYNGCDSGMTHCNQKVCDAKDKKPSKCQKKLVKKGKLHKCSKRKWGKKKCKKTCCEAGY